MKFMLALAGFVALVAAAPQGQAPAPTPTPTQTQTPPAAFQAIPTCGSNILNPAIEDSGCQFTGTFLRFGNHAEDEALTLSK
jgi:hypothetical protein